METLPPVVQATAVIEHPAPAREGVGGGDAEDARMQAEASFSPLPPGEYKLSVFWAAAGFRRELVSAGFRVAGTGSGSDGARTNDGLGPSLAAGSGGGGEGLAAGESESGESGGMPPPGAAAVGEGPGKLYVDYPPWGHVFEVSEAPFAAWRVEEVRIPSGCSHVFDVSEVPFASWRMG